MHDLRRADGRQVAVSLIGDDNLVGTRPFDCRGRSRRAAVRDLHVAHIKIVVGKHRAAHRAHEDRLVLQPQFLQRFGNQLVHHSVSAAGTVVGLVLQLRFALVQVIEHRRLGVDDFVSVAHFGTNSILASNSTSDLTFGIHFVIHYADHAFVCHFRCPLQTSSSLELVSDRHGHACQHLLLQLSTEGTLPPTRP